MSNIQYFVLRRLHSLLGVIPLGIFLFNHLLTNSTGILGVEQFEHKVALIHMLGPLLPLVEAVFIFIPLSLHIALGVYIALTARMESGVSYPRNTAYKFQRWTGWVALVFIVYHVIHLRFLHDMHAVPFSFVLARMFDGPMGVVIAAAYIVGGLSVVYHFANGLCTFCMTWGITVGNTSQTNMARFATAVGAVLTLMLLTSVVGFAREASRFHAMDSQQKMQVVESIKHYQHELDVEAAHAYLVKNFGNKASVADATGN